MSKEEIAEILSHELTPIIIFMVLSFLILFFILLLAIQNSDLGEEKKEKNEKHSDEYNECMQEIRYLHKNRCDDVHYFSTKIHDLKADVIELGSTCSEICNEIVNIKKDKSQKTKRKK